MMDVTLVFSRFRFSAAIVWLFVALLFAGTAKAQTDTSTTPDPVQQQIENLSENLENEDADYTNLIDNLSYYAAHPLNLNTASREDLEDLGLLNDVQLNALLAHREKFGTLISVYELQAVDGFDLELIFRILPYIKVYDTTNAGHFTVREMLNNGKHEFVARSQRIVENQKGFSAIDSVALAESPNSRYLGSPYRVFARYRFTYSNFVSWGFVADKDAGEEFFRGTQKQGFDFYSAHLAIRNIGPVKTLCIGDYQAGFGQGLTLMTGFAYGKTSDAVNVRRNAGGIRPYSSADETRFLRGAAVTMRFKKFDATVLYSRKRIDANILTSDTSGTDIEIIEVGSLQQTGLHTTPAEMADRRAITETVMGGHLSYNGTRLRVGMTGMYQQLGANLSRSLGVYNQFEFAAQKNMVLGVDYSYVYRNINFFGETARSENGGLATVNGLLMSLDSRLALSVHHRYLLRDFQNILGNAFADGSLPANEQGIFFGVRMSPIRRVTINAYIDRFQFPWLKFQIDGPSRGSDFLLQINYTPDKKTDMYFRYRHRERFINANDDDAEIDYIIPLTQDNYRFQIQYPASLSIRLRNRIEFTQYKPSNDVVQNGFVIWQDVTYKKLGSPIAFTGRLALFQSDSYFSRIYAYENDMPYVFSIPSYYYKGARMYAMINWDINRKFELWFRVARTVYTNQDVISEGSLTEIQGNARTEVKLQIRLKL
jgi:hypothetical protein